MGLIRQRDKRVGGGYPITGRFFNKNNAVSGVFDFLLELALKHILKIVEKTKNIGWTENFCLAMIMKHIMLRAIQNAEIVCSVDKYPPFSHLQLWF